MKVDDKTEIAELMKCFSETEIDNPKFPKLSRRAKFLKESEGGMMVMCDGRIYGRRTEEILNLNWFYDKKQ